MSISNQYIYTNTDGIVTELKKNYQISGDQYQVIAELTGPPTLSNDGLTFTKLTKDSVIKIKNLSDNAELKITERDGKAKYSYQVNEYPQPLTVLVKKTYMSGFFNHTPIAAKQRTDILYTRFGPDAAIDQLLSAANDDTKLAYIEAISTKQLTQSSQQKVLIALSSISSDYTQRVSAETFIKTQKPLSEQIWFELIIALDGMGSDYELRRSLVMIAPDLPNEADIKSAFLASSETIGSDYEKYRLITELATQKNAFKISELFAASDDIGSDYEAYRVVDNLAPLIKTQADFDAMLNFMQTIGSDYEMRRAITSLQYQNLAKAHTAEIIKLAADYIGSDYELAQTITYILDQTPYKLELNREITYAIASMSSDNEKVKLYKLM